MIDKRRIGFAKRDAVNRQRIIHLSSRIIASPLFFKQAIEERQLYIWQARRMWRKPAARSLRSCPSGDLND
jgi:hypothetical protein